jgi:hypothetical protein
VIRTLLPVIAIATLALIAFSVRASPQAQCPELDRLRREVAEAAKDLTGSQTPDRCQAYIRFSVAWAAIARYASEHRETCDISISSLDQFEKRHREAVSARDDICAGHLPFPPEINRR